MSKLPITTINKPGIKVLEIGSRVVTGANLRGPFDKAEYQSNSANFW